MASRCIPEPKQLSFLLVGALLAMGLAGESVWAQATTQTLRGLAPRRAAGVQVQFDGMAWPISRAYRPLRAIVTPTAANPADRTVTFEILYRKNYGNQRGLTVRHDVEIPAGSPRVSTILTCPEYGVWQIAAVDVYLDGAYEKNLSIQNPGFSWYENPPQVNITYLGSRPASDSVLKALMSNVWETEWSDFAQATSPGTPRTPQGARYIAASRTMAVGETVLPLTSTYLPQRWIDYSGLDVICVSLPNLEKLHREQPAAARAIADWTMSCGNVWVYGLGEGSAELGRVERALGLEPPNRDADAWTAPDRSLRRSDLIGWPMDPGSGAAAYAGPVQYAPPAVAAAPATAGDEDDDSSDPGARGRRKKKPAEPPPISFEMRPTGQGLVVAFHGDPFPGSELNWSWVMNSMGADRLLWQRRFGVSMDSGDDDFWRFLIPGVGLPPIAAFFVLITLFVIAIGPVNYWLLWRNKRLHLLLITAPALAGAVTVSLFVYAVFADGLGTRVRVRSATLLDQRTGRAVCWSRLSYYAGLSPYGGLEFSPETCVLPIPTEGPHESDSARRTWYLDDTQRFAAGWLPARTPTQFLTVRTRTSQSGLSIDETAKGVEVTNRLGAAARLLFLRTHDGRLMHVPSLPEGAKAVARPVDQEEMVKQLGRVFREDQQSLISAVGDGSNDGGGGIFGVRRRYYSPYGHYDIAGMETQCLERTIALLSMAGSSRFPLASPGSYVALVERSPEVELGTNWAREEASLHVVYGTW
ncbi:MAG: tripartite tricarboxylate transporter TctB family protein [Planctomycetota bacterium]